MSRIKLSIDVEESDKTLMQLAAKMIAKNLDIAFDRVLPALTRDIQEYIGDLIKASPEYASLVSFEDDELRAQFGLVDPVGKLNAIIDTWKQNIYVRKTPISVKGEKLSNNFKIGIIKKDWSDVLSLPEAVQDNRGRAGGKLEWLRWLLLEGDTTIVMGYKIEMNLNSKQIKNSRTGLAVMLKSENDRWFVPPQYAGTTTNNFITRSLKSIDLDKVILEHLKKALS